MPLLYLYLLRLFLGGFLQIVGLFIGFYFLIDGVESIRRFSQKVSFNWGDTLLMMACRLPAFITMLLPPLTLLAVLMVLARLSRQNEITVMRASGVSLKRILIPFLLGGVIIAAVQFIFQDKIVPHTNKVAQNLEDFLLGHVAAPRMEVDNLWLKSDQQLIHVHQILPDEQVLLDVMVFQFDVEHRLRRRLKASRAQMRQGKWVLFQGMIYSYGEHVAVEAFSQRAWDVTLKPEQLNRTSVDPNFLSFEQIYRLAERTEREGYDATRLRVLLYGKLTQPVTTLAAILLAFPFSLRLPRRGGVTRSLLLGLLIGFLMFVVTGLSKALGMGGRLPPLLSAWAPVLFFTGIGGFLLLHFADPRRH